MKKSQKSLLKAVLILAVISVAIAAIITFSGGRLPRLSVIPLSVFNAGQAGVSCNRQGTTLTCSYSFTASHTCPNTNYGTENIQVIRCPDTPQGIDNQLCGVYGGSWENGCCYGPYLNARAVDENVGEADPFNFVVATRDCGAGGPDVFNYPNVYPHFSGTLTITPLSQESPAQPTEACGNGVCGGSETPTTCLQDCNVAPVRVCGNAVCESGETPISCPADCSSITGGAVSTPTTQPAFNMMYLWIGVIAIVLAGFGIAWKQGFI